MIVAENRFRVFPSPNIKTSFQDVKTSWKTYTTNLREYVHIKPPKQTSRDKA
jgi:hypothetical protein